MLRTFSISASVRSTRSFISLFSACSFSSSFCFSSTSAPAAASPACFGFERRVGVRPPQTGRFTNAPTYPTHPQTPPHTYLALLRRRLPLLFTPSIRLAHHPPSCPHQPRPLQQERQPQQTAAAAGAAVTAAAAPPSEHTAAPPHHTRARAAPVACMACGVEGWVNVQSIDPTINPIETNRYMLYAPFPLSPLFEHCYRSEAIALTGATPPSGAAAWTRQPLPAAPLPLSICEPVVGVCVNGSVGHGVGEQPNAKQCIRSMCGRDDVGAF